MAKNDIIKNINHPTMTQDRMLSDDLCSKSEKESIHSGHFMVSDFNDDETESETPDEIPAAQTPNNEEKMYSLLAGHIQLNNKSTVSKVPVNSNLIAIDSSLTKLFNCMTLAYSGKLTSPKWKTFKGLKLRWKEKIRLNNVIWRAWHIQYIKKMKPIICQFASPFDGDTHNKPEAVVLEGKYWKRRLDTVCAEYKKWRIFYKEKLNISQVLENFGKDVDLLERLTYNDMGYRGHHGSMSPPQLAFEDEATLMDVLFTWGREPFMFPDPREIAQAGRADFIQPGLVQLQPDLDDFMDTMEPFQDYFNASKFGLPFSFNGAMNEPERPRPMPPVHLAEMNTRTRTPEQSIIRGMQPTSETVFNENLNQKLDTGGHISPHAAFTSNESQPVVMNFTPQQPPEINSQLAQIESYQLPNLSSSHPALNQIVTPQTHLRDSMDVSLLLSQNQQMVSLQPKPFMLNSQSPLNEIPKESRPLRKLSAPASLRLSHQNYSFLPPNNKSSIIINPEHTKFSSICPPTRHQSSTVVSHQPPVTVQTPINQFTLTTSSDMTLSSMMPTGSGLHSGQPTLPQMFATVNTHGSSVLDVKSASISTPVTTPAPNNVTFFVPKKTSSRIRPQKIAPAPPSSANLVSHSQVLPSVPVQSSQQGVLPQNLFLAQLLTNTTGTFSGPQNIPNKQDIVTDGNSASNFVMTPLIATVTGVSDFLLGTTQPTQAFSNMGGGNQVVDALISSIPTTSISNNRKVSTPTSSPPRIIDMTLTNAQNSDNLGVCSVKQPRVKMEHDRIKYKEHRRVCHINAEQKRRYNIKSGFDVLHSLLPSLSQNPTAKVSKAAMLQKAVEYIKTLKNERSHMQENTEYLKQQMEQLQQAINICQQQLPATGVPVTRQRTDKMKEMFDDYVRTRTLQNWKFWIFSIIIRPLFESYNNSVSTASLDDLCHSTLGWLEHHCSLMALRPAASNSLRVLSSTTTILTDPSKLREHATQAVTKKEAPS